MWYLVLAYMAFIFYLSSIQLQFPTIIEKFDPTKFILHAIEYSILGFLLFLASKKLAQSFFISSIYGISDEIHQAFVPFRVFSYTDILADFIGSAAGVIVTYLILKRLKNL
jgi:VanZ family protein